MKVKVSFDAGAAEERQRSFREATSKWAIGVTPDAPPEPGEEGGRIEAHVAGPFVLARAQAHTSAVRRTRADVASDTTLRFRLTRTPVDAWQRVGLTPTRDAEYHHSAGDFVISTNEWTFDSAARSGKSGAEMLVIPHHLLAPLLEGGRLTGPVVVPARSSVGALLTAGFFAAFKEVPLLPPDLGGAVLQNFCGLVALACGASDAGRDS
ncbi:MAG TPA: hypothetical protein VJY39_18575, partial [Acidisphaera sp.]|nr:hypothetical protein [Acidisphaera sp.]